MKRILIITIIFLFPALLFAQERVEKRIKLKDGTVLTGFVEQQQDGSYLIETDSGDILFFSPSEIANLTTVNEKSKALGDINSTDSIVYLKRGKIFFYANNEEVTQNDFAHVQVWQDYQRAQKIRRTGGTLAIIGGIMTGVGLICVIAGVIAGPDEVKTAGAVVAGTGASFTVSSIIVHASGTKKLEKIAETFNQQSGYVLDFGVQQHGIGFALKF